MGIIIGIDGGVSTTKIVGIEEGQVKAALNITATDHITSLFGAFGKYLYDNHIDLNRIDRIMLTGVGSSRITQPIYGLPTYKVDEFLADGLGAKHFVKADPLIVVSMGTGTTFVEVKGDHIEHVGGLAMGGGTLQGLASTVLKLKHISNLEQLASSGDLSRVNLRICDISEQALENLPMHATASLFGKASTNMLTDADIALGLICMVLETIGSAAVLAAKKSDIKDIVLIGNLTRLEQCNLVFPLVEQVLGAKFHIPEMASFCTAVGAALATATFRI